MIKTNSVSFYCTIWVKVRISKYCFTKIHTCYHACKLPKVVGQNLIMLAVPYRRFLSN